MSDVTDISFNKMLIAGPLVSFNGSPIVSPQTALECSLSPFFTIALCPGYLNSSGLIKLPASVNFFALSQAPPVFEAEKAI